MTYKELKKIIATHDAESLAWWTPEEIEEMGLRFSTIEKAQKEGVLVYCGKDDLYFGRETFKEIQER